MAGMFDPANQARFREAIGAGRRLKAGLERVATFTAAQMAAIATAFTNGQGRECMSQATQVIAAVVPEGGLIGIPGMTQLDPNNVATCNQTPANFRGQPACIIILQRIVKPVHHQVGFIDVEADDVQLGLVAGENPDVVFRYVGIVK